MLSTATFWKLKKIIQLLILLVSICYIIWYFWFSREEIVDLAVQLRPVLIMSTAIIYSGYLLLHGFRFKLVIEKSSGRKLTYIIWFKYFILGRFLNQIFPQFGNFYRSYKLKKTWRISYSDYIASFLSFAWMDSVLNFFVTFIILLVFKPSLILFGLNGTFLILVILVLTVSGPIIINLLTNYLNFKSNISQWLNLKINIVTKASVRQVSEVLYVLWFIFLGSLSIVLALFLYYFLFSALGVSVGIPSLMLFYTLFKLSTFVNVTPGNLGIRELAYGVLSLGIGGGMISGIMVSGILRILSFIVLLIMGIAFGGIDILRHREEIVRQ